MQNLLVQAHHLAHLLDQQRDGTDSEAAVDQLRGLLDQISMTDLAPQLRAAGLAAKSTEITGFLQTQKQLVEAQTKPGKKRNLSREQRQNLTDFLSQMQRLVPKLRCEKDPSWKPENAMDGTSGTTPTGSSGLGNNSIIAKNAPVVSMFTFGLVILLLGGSILLRHHAKTKRRRARRLPCALSCTISFIPDKKDRSAPTARRGKMCDISQLGAKVCVDESIPDTLKQCKLYSHGWSAGGRVIWRNAQCMGIAFKRALPAQELYNLVRLNRKLHTAKRNGTQ